MSEYKIDVNKKFKHLNHAPIIEAVIEIKVPPTAKWNVDQLKVELAKQLTSYPKIDDTRLFTYQVAAGPGVEGGAQQKAEDRGRVGYRLESADKKHLAQFNIDVFRFSRVEPYSDWKSFTQEAFKLWEVYYKLLSPPQVLRIGVRYINRMPFSPRTESLADYFNDELKEKAILDWPIKTFFYQNQLEILGSPFKANVIKTRVPFNDAEALILDIDVFLEGRPFKYENKVLSYYLDQMHIVKNEIFKGSVTPKAIEKFI